MPEPSTGPMVNPLTMIAFSFFFMEVPLDYVALILTAKGLFVK
jgi:hypothetical protein